MDFKHTIVFIAPFVLMSGCQVQTASKAVELTDTLFKTLNLFLEASKSHKESVNQAVQKAKDGLEPQESPFPIPIPGITNSGKVNLLGVANEWEKDMGTVFTRTEEMRHKLDDIKNSSKPILGKNRRSHK